MELWNDYEGKTVDGQFPLERLLSPEGRSAFFTTTDAAGQPGVLRLIESHFDEEEILARWRTVSALGQEHLVGIERAGQATIDGTKLVYALIEPTDADLGQILRERALSAEEAKQVGMSVVQALAALHGAGLVHEHLEPSSVMAKGEVVKLRSDCVREAPEGHEGDEVRARDVQALATLMLEALTQRKQLGAVGAAPLPYPFEEVVRNGLSGAWGVAEITRALVPAPPVVPGTRPNGAGRAAAGAAPAGAASGGTGVGRAGAVVTAGTAAPPVRIGSGPAAGPPRVAGGGAEAVAASATSAPPRSGMPAAGSGNMGTAVRSTNGVGTAAAGVAGVLSGASAAPIADGAQRAGIADDGVSAFARTDRRPAPEAPGRIVMEPTLASPKRMPLIAGGAVAAVLLAGVGWYFGHRPAQPASAPTVTSQGSAPPTAAVTPSGPAAARAPAAAAARHPDKPSAVLDKRYGHAATAASAGGRANWRVVAFTYNREEQAQHKVAQIAERHAGLKPGVFTPNGRAPYLVTLGGEMTLGQAESLRARARSEGMPSDTFARNYNGR